VGVTGIIVGAVEVTRNGRACDPAPGYDNCPERRDTQAGQIFGFTLGGLGLVGAAVLAYLGWGRQPPKAARVSLAPHLGPSQAGAALFGTF
jgi:hypothetical protein